MILISRLLPDTIADNEITEDDFDLEEFIFGDPYQSLAELMCEIDGSGVMGYADNGYGEDYYLYCPSYPWTWRKNEPKSISEVHRIIIKTISKITNLKLDQIEAMIDDDIYDHGCG